VYNVTWTFTLLSAFGPRHHPVSQPTDFRAEITEYCSCARESPRSVCPIRKSSIRATVNKASSSPPSASSAHTAGALDTSPTQGHIQAPCSASPDYFVHTPDSNFNQFSGVFRFTISHKLCPLLQPNHAAPDSFPRDSRPASASRQGRALSHFCSKGMLQDMVLICAEEGRARPGGREGFDGA